MRLCVGEKQNKKPRDYTRLTTFVSRSKENKRKYTNFTHSEVGLFGIVAYSFGDGFIHLRNSLNSSTVIPKSSMILFNVSNALATSA